MHVTKSNASEGRRIPESHAAGEAYAHRLDASVTRELKLNIVRFAAGGRSHWHVHSFEQGMIVTSGRGIVATEAEEAVIEAGDVVVVAAHEKHWHGATDTSPMTHVVVDGSGETTILEPVEHIRTSDL